MHFQYLLTAADIWQAHYDLAVETTRSQQCWIKYIGAVGSRDDDHTIVHFKTIHLYQQLVECLFPLIVSAT